MWFFYIVLNLDALFPHVLATTFCTEMISIPGRLFGCHKTIGEAVSLRRFAEGRTEFLRSNTSQSHTFCQAMDDCTVTHNIKRRLLRDAINRHKLNITKVSWYSCIFLSCYCTLPSEKSINKTHWYKWCQPKLWLII